MTGYLTQNLFSLWSTHVAFWKRYTQDRVEPKIRVHVNLHPGHAHIGHTTLQPWLYYDLLNTSIMPQGPTGLYEVDLFEPRICTTLRNR